MKYNKDESNDALVNNILKYKQLPIDAKYIIHEQAPELGIGIVKSKLDNIITAYFFSRNQEKTFDTRFAKIRFVVADYNQILLILLNQKEEKKNIVNTELSNEITQEDSLKGLIHQINNYITNHEILTNNKLSSSMLTNEQQSINTENIVSGDNYLEKFLNQIEDYKCSDLNTFAEIFVDRYDLAVFPGIRLDMFHSILKILVHKGCLYAASTIIQLKYRWPNDEDDKDDSNKGNPVLDEIDYSFIDNSSVWLESMDDPLSLFYLFVFFHYKKEEEKAYDYFVKAELHNDMIVSKLIADKSQELMNYLSEPIFYFNMYIFWLEKAAIEGNVQAQYEMGFYYFDRSGRSGIDSNLVKKQFFWLHKAATNGYLQAQVQLALDYSYGRHGLYKNNTKALYWFNVALANGFQPNIDEKDLIKAYELEKSIQQKSNLTQKDIVDLIFSREHDGLTQISIDDYPKIVDENIINIKIIDNDFEEYSKHFKRFIAPLDICHEKEVQAVKNRLKLQWNDDGTHIKTGTNYDEDGYNQQGWSKYGWSKAKLHIKTSTKYDMHGYDINGIDRNGWHKLT